MKSMILIAWMLTTLGLMGADLKVGDELPKTQGTNHLGKKVKIAPAEGSEWLLVFFYPKALTGG